MTPSARRRPPTPVATDTTADAARYRSGAVARMVRMPVATLRIWERRYRVAAPELTPSGQRLYTAADVRRIGLLKQLTDLGHAIGSLATLSWEQLQSVAHTHAHAVAGKPRIAPAADVCAAWRVAVVGATLAKRVMRPAVQRAAGHPMAVAQIYDDLQQATAARPSTRVDALLVLDARPDAATWTAALARERRPRDVPIALLYRFAAEPLCQQLAAAGVALLREPQGDTALGQWLGRLPKDEGARPAAPEAPPDAAAGAPARRWDDAQLTDFAGLSSTIACECPQHVAELLMQLSHFEAYSADCASRSVADAELHRYLHAVAGASRALFEQALERVAIHEGLLMPS